MFLLLSIGRAGAAPCGTSLPGNYLLAFLGCDHSIFNCADPFNHRVYLAVHAAIDVPISNPSFVSVVNAIALGLGPNFEIGSPSIAVNAPTVSPRAFGLNVSKPGVTISWSAFPNANSYDLIRGDLSSLTCATDHVDLGAVTCLIDNVAATGFDDPIDPAPGGGFFYLVRPNVSVAKGSYGYAPEGGEEAPAAGGCP